MQTIRLLLLCLLMAIGAVPYAQQINVPSVSSQYISQDKDYGAVDVYVQYADKSPSFLLNEQKETFSQATLNTYLDQQLSKYESDIARQTVIRLHAPKNLPVHFVQDFYLWVQIYGNQQVHLVGREGTKLQYIPLDVMPFPQLKAAYEYYKTKQTKEASAMALVQQAHPKTTKLSKEIKKDLPAAAAPMLRIQDYIPHKVLYLDIKDGNNVLFKNQKANPMVLANFIQGELFSNYQGNKVAAKADKYFWLNINIDETVSYQVFLETLVAAQEGFYLYWDELAFEKYQKTYLELSIKEKFALKQTSPMLITFYDKAQLAYLNDKLIDGKAPKTWAEMEE